MSTSKHLGYMRHNRKVYGGSKSAKRWTPRKKDFEQDKQIANVKKSVAKINSKVELKFNDTTGSLDPSITGTFRALNAPAQTTTASTVYLRDGNSIYNTSIQIKGYLQGDALVSSALSDVNRTVRVVLFWDKETNGTLPALTDLFDNSTITDFTQAPYNSVNSQRFRILSDKIISLNPIFAAGGTQVVPARKTIRIKKKLGRKSDFDAAGSGIGSMESNALILVSILDVAGATNANQPTINISTRAIFKDS